MSYTKEQCREFITAYFEAAAFAETASGAPEDTGDGTFDTSFQNYGADMDDVAPAAKIKAMRDCLRFIDANIDMLERAGTPERNGDDYWLTRQHHGAGFWDRGYPENVSRALTDAAHADGSRDLYYGYDGRIYGF